MIKFTPLWETLSKRNMRKSQLVDNRVITSATLAKISKDSTVNSETIDKLCKFLKCPITDVVEFVDDSTKD